MSHRRSYFTQHLNKHTTDGMCRTLRILSRIIAATFIATLLLLTLRYMKGILC